MQYVIKQFPSALALFFFLEKKVIWPHQGYGLALLEIGVMIPYDATVKCIALPFTFLRKLKNAGHLNFWGTEVQ